jgi:hypothetical protein
VHTINRIHPNGRYRYPEDYLPPEGAVRLYAKDTEWMKRLEDLARRASWILIQVGNSANLRWELEHLRHQGLQTKLFIITPPTRGAPGDRYLRHLHQWMKGIRAEPWSEFAEKFGSLGYELVPTDPGSGAVITFDTSGKSVVLTTGAKEPEDYVRAIQSWAPVTKALQ